MPGQGMDIHGFALGQQLGQFGKGNVWVMAGGFGWCGDHTQVGGRVGIYHALGKSITEYLM
ncbi:hypothetical protein D3C71_2183310 [compost metagenome]